MIFSYYQPLDPFGHSFRYVHITQREGRETMTAARHKLCQDSHGQKLYQIDAALMQQALPGSHRSKACFFITVFSNLCCCLQSSGLLIRHASGMSPKSKLPHCCNATVAHPLGFRITPPCKVLYLWLIHR